MADLKPVAWLAKYVDKHGEIAVYVTTHYDLAVESDDRGKPDPLYKQADIDTLRAERDALQACVEAQSVLPSLPTPTVDAMRDWVKDEWRISLDEVTAERDALRDKALRYDLDQAGITQREKEAVELVELRATLQLIRDKIGHFADAPSRDDMPMLGIIIDVARIAALKK